jgi:DNA-binding IclR family transcriptional regulator
VILSSLCMSAPPEAVFPPRAPIRVSLSELSRSFGVSRAHVRRLIQDAARQGLMERGADGETIRILPRLDAAMRRATAMSFLYHADCVRRALADVARNSAVA